MNLFSKQNPQRKQGVFAMLVSVLGLGIVVSIISVVYVRSLLSPLNPDSVETVRFVIPKGQAVSTIGERLESEGLIKSSLAFRLVVEMYDLGTDIQAGSFDLSPAATTQEIATALTQGTEDVWITLLEGWRREEIAESLAAEDLDFFDQDEFLELSKGSEGMLFPDTYLIPREMTTENIYSLLKNTFDRKVTQGLSEEIAESEYSFEEILVMASLVEREARNYDQMRVVAGILWNRIELGMALQVDATLQYASGYNVFEQSWWVPPTPAQKEINSPFNTYQNPGLPPQPIANPSLNAIKATLNPEQTNDLFYIHALDGSMYTASTLEQHNANINRYLR